MLHKLNFSSTIKSFFKKFFHFEEKVYPFNCASKNLQDKVFKDSFIFFLVFIFSVTMAPKMGFSFFLFGIMVFIFCIGNIYYLYYSITRDHIKEITGVVIATEFTGYRKQHKKLYIQDEDDTVYSIMVRELKEKFRFKTGNIITFYTNENNLNHYENGEYHIGYPLLVIRTNAKIR